MSKYLTLTGNTSTTVNDLRGCLILNFLYIVHNNYVHIHIMAYRVVKLLYNTASFHGHDQIVQRLVDAGAAIDTQKDCNLLFIIFLYQLIKVFILIQRTIGYEVYI